MKKVTVYLDMDGVLVFWFEGFAKLFNLTPEEYEELKQFYIKHKFVEDCPVRPKEEWEKWIDLANENNGEWWYNLNPLPWAKELYGRINELDIVDEVAFLTSPGKKYTLCWEQKRQWLKKHIGADNLICTPYKYHCAGRGKILVDDTFKHCKQFIEHGGNAVLWPNNFDLMNLREGNSIVYRKIDKTRLFGKELTEDHGVFDMEAESWSSFMDYFILHNIMIPATVWNNS